MNKNEIVIETSEYFKCMKMKIWHIECVGSNSSHAWKDKFTNQERIEAEN
jgi:hypothetical protein